MQTAFFSRADITPLPAPGAQPQRSAEVTTFPALDALLDEWTELFDRAECRNPFARPDFLIPWLRAFVADGDLRVTTIRDDRGVLAAVAPFYRQRVRLLPGVHVTKLELPGCGQHSQLPELAEILTLPAGRRALLRQVIEHLLATGGWDWIELSLTPTQGWFEPQWIPQQPAGQGNMVMHRGVRSCVVLPVGSGADALFGSLKRNIKESLRRARNRLARAGLEWSVEVIDRPGDELERAVGDLVRLHHARSRMPGHLTHMDYLGEAGDPEFLAEVVQPLAASGHLEANVLRVGEDTAAVLLTFRAGRATYFWLSGLDPAFWDYGCMTLLQADCIRRAASDGQAVVNLSVGPAPSKLRWSEDLEHWQDFSIVGARRRSRYAYMLHAYRRLGQTMRYALFYRNKTTPEGPSAVSLEGSPRSADSGLSGTPRQSPAEEVL
jgi:CelD/BcsL family acetyltransferase involved in cellulose biosynthesis